MPQNNIFINDIVLSIKKEYKGNIIENDKECIEPYEANLFFPEENFVIVYKSLLENSIGFHDTIKELDSYRNFSLRNELKKKDKKILKICREKNYELFIILENELLDDNKREIWKSMIFNKLKLNKKKYYARDCVIKEVDPTTSKMFFEENHIQGNAPSLLRLGLYHKKEPENVLSILSMGVPRYNKQFDFEIIRFATKKYSNVVGGGNKLFQHFLEKYSNGENILTYANTRWSTNGAFYQKLGFEKQADAQENYFYFKEEEKRLYPRIRFQKHKLDKVLPVFNSAYTEMENVLFLNKVLIEGETDKYKSMYRQIYDSGNIVMHLIQKK